MTFKDWILVISSTIATYIGIKSFLDKRSEAKVNLSVVPRSFRYEGIDNFGRKYYLYNSLNYIGGKSGLSVNIINNSKFAAIVSEVGFSLANESGRLALVYPIIPSNKKLPIKLDPRESISIHFDTKCIIDTGRVKDIDRIYVHTACGTQHLGKRSNIIKEFVRYNSRDKILA